MTFIKLRFILIFVNSYNTKQRNDVIAFFASSPDRSFTVEEASANLSTVPRSTVYRLITRLSEEGILRKTGSEGRKAVYQYQGKECAYHMHIRCRECGRTEHLDAEATRKIEEIISVSSSFVALDTTVIEGLCNECRSKIR